MAKRILGGYNVTHNATARGVRTAQSIDGNAGFDATGHMNFDGFTESEIENIIGVLPISHYGTHNYLPAGVSGSFDGASENTSARRIKLQLDNDGTLVFLRPGTNGSTVGVYYSYLPNALFASNLTTSVNTNRLYKPGYFTGSDAAYNIIASDRGLVTGVLMDRTTLYTSFTNGTLDDRQHYGFKMPISTVQPTGTVLTFVMTGTDGYLYYFSKNETGNSFTIALTRVLYNRTTNTYTATRITGFNNTGFYGDISNASTDIVIQSTTLSSNAADKPYALSPTTATQSVAYMSSYDIFAAQEASTGNIRIRINGDMWCTTPNYNTRPQHGFSFVMNPNTKTNRLDAGYDRTTTTCPLVITDTGSALVATGNVITNDVFYTHITFNLATTYFYSPDGFGICISTPNLGEPPYVQVCDFTKTSVYNMINQKVYRSSNARFGRLNQSYGSVIGSNISGITILPNNRTLQTTRNGAGNPILALAEHKAPSTFTFDSLELGTIKGYEPTTNRKTIANTVDNKSLITTISSTNSTANGGILILGKRLSTGLSYNENMVASGSISIGETLLSNFRTAEFNKVSSTFGLNTTSSRDIVLYVPQQTDIPAFAILTTVTNNQTLYVRVVEVNVNTRSGNITTLTYSRLAAEYVMSGSLNPRNNATISQHSSCGISITSIGPYYFIGGGNPLTNSTIGNNMSMMFRAVVNPATRQFIRFNNAGEHADYTNGNLPGALPGFGFGIFSPLDLTTKIIFRSYGTTLSDYDTWADKGAAPVCVVSQDVAQGFIVYFTEDTPVLLSGKSFTLPKQTIDLTTIKANPANSTFNIYVRMYQGNAQYLISEDIIAESGTTAYNLLWIGQIQTDSLQISNINILKRSRLDVFGESLENRGSSFPVSYGLPSAGGNITW